MVHTFAVEISSDCYGYHNGQKDVIVRAATTDAVVGKLHYSVYGGKLHIAHIWTAREWRRWGVATGLLREMERDNPGLPVNWGYTSEAGAGAQEGVGTVPRLTFRLALVSGLTFFTAPGKDNE